MRPALTRRAARAYAGPNWRGVGRVDVDADMHGVEPGATLVVNFDRRSVVAGGQYLVDIGGWPELVRFRRFSRGLCARIGRRWLDLSGGDLCEMDVIARVVRVVSKRGDGRCL